MRKRLMASTAAIIIVGFLVAFALAAKLVQDQYQLEFTRRLDSILAMMESQVDDIGQDPQGFAVKIGKELQEKGQEIRITILDSGGNVIGDSGIGEQGTLPAENHLYRPEIQQAQKEDIVLPYSFVNNPLSALTDYFLLLMSINLTLSK